ncbi:MAG: D-alanyl-D-alanine carboxypeptidase [Treponema sp.]|nr:D-alanyl-D-alanine carboxypeptidase [Treponema sp.]
MTIISPKSSDQKNSHTLKNSKNKNRSQNQQNQNKNKNLRIAILSFAILLFVAAASFTSFTIHRSVQFSKITEAEPLSLDEQLAFSEYLNSAYPQNNEILHSLPYNCSADKPQVYAESAILIDVSNGNIIYEKNADEVIPPASMTKLFAMYVVDQEVSNGLFSYDDIIPLPPESWACNMPPHSSLMFLGEGQRVTLEELLLGLSICSGNDAAYAIAYTISGSMEKFIARMNKVATDLGLTHTHFVESSGYSEENTTTAREMAAFCRIYLSEHPDCLKRFHSVPSFTYPKKHNLAPGDVFEQQDFTNGYPRHITMSITQKNTNPLLGILQGCDGLKTGFIDESGYNLALTAFRDNTRFLSVTMLGPGNSSREGQANRIHDGTELMEFAFSSFRDFYFKPQPHFVKVYGAKKMSLNLVPAEQVDSICIPSAGLSAAEAAKKIRINTELPERLTGQIIQGTQLGQIQIYYDTYLLNTIPLITDRTIEESNFIVKLADSFIK